MIKLLFASCLISIILSVPSLGVVETYQFSDPILEKRYRQLSIELRCPKCQNQNIAESNAPISRDLRRALYEQLEAGSSDREILDYMAIRYGEFVRYRPDFSKKTALLWIVPFLFLVFGLGILWLVLKRAESENDYIDKSPINVEPESFFAEDKGSS